MPVLDALQRLVRPPNVEHMIALLRRAAPLWLAQMPWLLGESDAAALRQSLRGARPERMPRELANLIETLTAEVALVLVLEDLHWSDPATVDLLTLLAQRRDPARLLVIATHRPADVAVSGHALGPAVRTLRAHGRCTELALADLTREDVGRFLDRRFPGHAFPPAFADHLHAHTGGQPLFAVALAEHLLSRGLILETAPGWALSMALDKVDLGVPDDIRRLLEGQFHSLSPGERGVLEAASVAGAAIVAALLAAAIGRSHEAAEELCEALARSQRFLAVAGTHRWPDGTSARRYAFTHELHRRVVYDETPEERRIRLHAAIGRALERAQGDRVYDIAPQLAAHFDRGHDAARTLHYLTVAGSRARERFASREAGQYLQRALALVDALDDPDERQRREVEVRLALGRALADIHGFAAETVRENYERVSELCPVTGTVAQAFEALYARWYVHALRAERGPTLALAEDLATVAAHLGTPGYAVLADATLVRTAYYDGRFADAVRHMASLRDNVARDPAATMPIAYGIDPVLAATTHCAGAIWFLGDAEGARAMMRGAVAGARDTGNPLFLTATLAPAAQLEVLIGNDDAADELATESEAVAASQGFSMWQAYAACWKTQARLRHADPVDGSRGIEQALAVMGATQTRLAVDLLQAFLAEAHLRAGARAQGLAAVEAGLQAVADGLLCNYEPDLWRLKAELLLMAAAPPTRSRRRSPGTATRAALGADWPEAERCFLRAIERAHASGAASLELRAALGLGRAWQGRGRTGDASALLTAICQCFDPASTAPDLVSARALQQAMTAGR
jgi:hypothetical protein